MQRQEHDLPGLLKNQGTPRTGTSSAFVLILYWINAGKKKEAGKIRMNASPRSKYSVDCKSNHLFTLNSSSCRGGGDCFSILHFNFIFLLKWYPQCYLTQGNTEFDGISSSRNFISEKSRHFCLDQNIASFSRSSSVVYQADCPSAGKQHWLESSGPNQLMIHLSDRQEVASCKAHKTWKDLHRVRVQHWELGLCLIQTINVGLNSKFISSHHSWINLACRS